MIALGFDVVGLQHIGQILYLLTRQTIDDAALARVLLDETHNVLVDVLGLGTHLVVEVGTVERALELGGIDDAEVLLDIGTHLVGSRSGQRDDRSLPYLVDNRTDATVLGTEVVAPLRDTMGLINGIE